MSQRDATLATAAAPGARLGPGRKLLFTTLIVVLLLALLEGVVRARAWLRYGSVEIGTVDSMLVVDPASGLRVPRAGIVRQGERTAFRVNSLGFRGEEVTVEKPPRTVRIATLGASTTFCAEVSNEATWPARLQQTLQRLHPDVKVEVINAGVPGYVVADSLKNLQYRVLPLKPDLVIYYEANNDLAVDTRELARQRGLLPEPDGAAVQFLGRHSLLFDLVRKNARILWASRSDAPRKLESLPPDLPARFIGQLDRIHQTLEGQGIPLIMSTFFVKYRRDQPRDVQLRHASISFFYMPWMTIDGLLDGIDMYNNAIVEYARAHGVAVVDDRTSIPGDDEHFVDWAHFGDAGTAAMAERFANFLEQQGLMQQVVKGL